MCEYSQPIVWGYVRFYEPLKLLQRLVGRCLDRVENDTVLDQGPLEFFVETTNDQIQVFVVRQRFRLRPLVVGE